MNCLRHCEASLEASGSIPYGGNTGVQYYDAVESPNVSGCSAGCSARLVGYSRSRACREA